GSSQGYDYLSRQNTFQSNYWDDWIIPDENTDGVVDIPYFIEGNVNNADNLPSVAPNNPTAIHYLTRPKIQFLDELETLKGTVLIHWAPGTDSQNHSITYAFYYSDDEGSHWILEAENLTSTSYTWDTTKVSDGTTYLVKIKAVCSEGLTAEDISNTLTIMNDWTATSSIETVSTPFLGLVRVLFALLILVIVIHKRKQT
ncbi:MAG: fibronectin type III domain-containing protein, partial [Candidatus Hodarchaeota archaeon]